MKAIDDNVLYRWFVGLNLKDKVWDHSTFSANRKRLFNEELAHACSSSASGKPPTAPSSSATSSAEGTLLIEAWAR